jgi:Fe-S-cluster containining protein
VPPPRAPGLDALRASLRADANRERAGLFSCEGCVAWCCREGFNSMRATPAEAAEIVAFLRARGGLEDALERCGEAVERWRLDGDPESRRTYTCPFLTAGNRCGVHEAKPLGCVSFTPVRDGGCDQDGERLGAAVRRLRGGDLPIPLAVLAAARIARPSPPR